jgi:hypothetical protein
MIIDIYPLINLGAPGARLAPAGLQHHRLMCYLQEKNMYTPSFVVMPSLPPEMIGKYIQPFECSERLIAVLYLLSTSSIHNFCCGFSL